jgi:hypothetical protein
MFFTKIVTLAFYRYIRLLFKIIDFSGIAETKYEFRCKDVPWKVSTRVWASLKIIFIPQISNAHIPMPITYSLLNTVAKLQGLNGCSGLFLNSISPGMDLTDYFSLIPVFRLV